MIYIVTPNYKITDKSAVVINTTSRSTDFGRELSPFFVGPCSLYNGYISKNVENAWQFSKVYPKFIDESDNIKPEYFEWATKGWESNWAYRYPMGKGTKPICSYWNGERLDYLNARKKIYIPLYSEGVRKTKAWNQLKELYKNCQNSLFLIDFDAHNLIQSEIDYDILWNNPKIKVGHAYVLAMMLKEKL